MLAGAARSNGNMWGRSRNGEQVKPLRPPSAEVVSKPAIELPTSAFIADYNGMASDLNAFKVENDQGRIRVVSTFKQGFNGQGAERYPSGQTYVGGYVEAKRHGVGTFIETNGDALVSRFHEGKPTGEGTIFNPSKGSPTATRTYQGKKDDVISTKEGAAIAKNIGASVPTGFVVAKTPPAAVRVREPVSYTTESKGSYQAPPEDGSRAIHTIPPRDVFLQKLEMAEARDTSTWQARSSLIPRIE